MRIFRNILTITVIAFILGFVVLVAGGAGAENDNNGNIIRYARKACSLYYLRTGPQHMDQVLACTTRLLGALEEPK